MITRDNKMITEMITRDNGNDNNIITPLSP